MKSDICSTFSISQPSSSALFARMKAHSSAPGPAPTKEGGIPDALPGARPALVLLLSINLFNYIDRQVLAAVVDPIKRTFFDSQNGASGSATLDALQEWCRSALGFKPELALIGVLSMAFMVTYMVCAPIFGRLAERYSRWLLIAVGVGLWSVASGASGLAAGFIALLVTRCFVGIGEAAYGPVAPTLIRIITRPGCVGASWPGSIWRYRWAALWTCSAESLPVPPSER
jgi:MFS family permease